MVNAYMCQVRRYIFRPQGLAADFPSVYFEPSNSFVPDELEKQGAVDVVIAPVESKSAQPAVLQRWDCSSPEHS